MSKHSIECPKCGNNNLADLRMKQIVEEFHYLSMSDSSPELSGVDDAFVIDECYYCENCSHTWNLLND